MQIVEGGDLHNWLDQNKNPKSRNEDQVVGFFLQMVAVVWYLTSNRIVHRDLKPQNFLIREGNIVLIDFGLSKESDESIIEMESKCGTPPYMAPEIFNSEPYNEKVDVYALAVILY